MISGFRRDISGTLDPSWYAENLSRNVDMELPLYAA